jgi:serine/threonine protein kinase
MGEVYLAEDPRLRRKVALKTVPDANRTEEARKRLRSEARAAARLTHPNVAAVYDVVEADDAVHVVMEYVVGETLARRVREKQVMMFLQKPVGHEPAGRARRSLRVHTQR